MVSFVTLQTQLSEAGYDPGVVDGVWGPKTLGALMRFSGRKKVIAGVDEIAAALIEAFAKHAVITPLRIAHFLAQASHESMGFQTLTEMGGQAYFKMYDPGTAKGRELGNTEPGDGARYRGRGLFQITGRDNYRAFGRLIGLNLEAHPEIAANPDVAAKTAVEFWNDRGLNGWADQNNIARITKLINGGNNGIEDRRQRLERIKDVWGIK